MLLWKELADTFSDINLLDTLKVIENPLEKIFGMITEKTNETRAKYTNYSKAHGNFFQVLK